MLLAEADDAVRLFFKNAGKDSQVMVRFGTFHLGDKFIHTERGRDIKVLVEQEADDNKKSLNAEEIVTAENIAVGKNEKANSTSSLQNTELNKSVQDDKTKVDKLDMSDSKIKEVRSHLQEALGCLMKTSDVITSLEVSALGIQAELSAMKIEEVIGIAKKTSEDEKGEQNESSRNENQEKTMCQSSGNCSNTCSSKIQSETETNKEETEEKSETAEDSDKEKSETNKVEYAETGITETEADKEREDFYSGTGVDGKEDDITNEVVPMLDEADSESEESAKEHVDNAKGVKAEQSVQTKKNSFIDVIEYPSSQNGSQIQLKIKTSRDSKGLNPVVVGSTLPAKNESDKSPVRQTSKGSTSSSPETASEKEKTKTG